MKGAAPSLIANTLKGITARQVFKQFPEVKKQLWGGSFWSRSYYVGTAISYYEQQNDLPEIKAEIREEYQDIAAHVLQDVLRRLDKAFQAFFRRVKNGEHPGYPRFQGQNRSDSFTYPDGAGWKLTVEQPGKKLKGVLHLTKIGDSKVKLHRPIEGKIKTCTIKREVDAWYVTFSCEVEEPEKLPASYEDVGIDLGVTHLATLSNGEMIEHPRYYRKAKKGLEQRQHALSRMKRGSHQRNKAAKRLPKPIARLPINAKTVTTRHLKSW